MFVSTLSHSLTFSSSTKREVLLLAILSAERNYIALSPYMVNEMQDISND